MKIAIEKAQVGMVLAEDVTISGGVLLNKSQILDENIIDLAVSCGVTTIDVQEGKDTPGTDTGPAEASSTNETPAPNPATQPALESPSSTTMPNQPEKTETPAVSDRTNSDDLQATLPQTPPVQSPGTPTDSDQQPPTISIRITPDAMSATLIIEPPERGTPAGLSTDMIMNALAEKEIVYGIDTAAVDRLVEAWGRMKRRYEASNIAVGTEAQASREGAFQMNIRHLKSRPECEEVEACTYYWEVAVEYPRIDRVSKGTPVAQKQTGQIAPPGKNILGVPVFSEEVVKVELTLEKNVSFSSDESQVLANVDGIAYMIDDTIGVIPINFDGVFECSIAPDAMSAEVTVHPPGPEGSVPDKDTLKRQLAEKGVNYGILDSEIDALFLMCDQGVCPADPVVVARGKPPQNGKNGSIKYHFNTETSLTPAISEKGQADYKSVNIVNSVTTDQILATLLPPGEGVDGTDVTGKKRPAKAGIPARLPQGPKTKADPEHPDTLLAATEGIARLSGAVVEVCEGFVVPGNVDFSTGNIDYNKTVIVNGDVKAGFNIHCGADLQVNGTIEDCQVTVGGNVLCRYGFLGQGKGAIDAKGDVNLGFMKNQKVRCFKNITIAKEAINCTLHSRGSITVHGSPLSVAGGELKARNSITVHTAGNHTGIKTLLEAGVDFLMAEELDMIRKQQKELSDQIKSINEAYGRFRKSLDAVRRPSTAQQKKNTDFIAALQQAQKKLAVLEERENVVAGKIHQPADAVIRIEHIAYPGTLLKFGERHFLIKEELTGPKKVRYIGHEIKLL